MLHKTRNVRYKLHCSLWVGIPGRLGPATTPFRPILVDPTFDNDTFLYFRPSLKGSAVFRWSDFFTMATSSGTGTGWTCEEWAVANRFRTKRKEMKVIRMPQWLKTSWWNVVSRQSQLISACFWKLEACELSDEIIIWRFWTRVLEWSVQLIDFLARDAATWDMLISSHRTEIGCTVFQLEWGPTCIPSDSKYQNAHGLLAYLKCCPSCPQISTSSECPLHWAASSRVRSASFSIDNIWWLINKQLFNHIDAGSVHSHDIRFNDECTIKIGESVFSSPFCGSERLRFRANRARCCRKIPTPRLWPSWPGRSWMMPDCLLGGTDFGNLPQIYHTKGDFDGFRLESRSCEHFYCLDSHGWSAMRF